ncbi:hypothetical protein [Streptomyces anandii]|uniref:hypothetical protein n=1 Tax=Streptomyces anandii TaxID=285454 RepID=UPI0036BE6ADE
MSTNPPDSYQLVIGTGTYEGARYVIVNSSHTGSAASYIYFVDGANSGLLAKIADGSHSKSHRIVDTVYLVPDIKNPGVGCSYRLSDGLVTIIASMPVGYASIVYKDRLWISGRRSEPNSSRLYFSDLASFDSWPGTNFFDIAPGDGDAVNELIVYQDNIIIFKDNATYVLTYDTGPAQAVLQVINTDVGAMGPRCVDVYENSVFILKYNQLYEMSNYDFVRVSVKIPFEYDNSFPISSAYTVGGQWWKYPFWLRVVGDRAIVRFYNRIYVYHLRLRAWTRWESEDPNIHYIGPIMRLDNTNTDVLRGFDTYVAGSTLAKSMDRQGIGTSGNWTLYFKIFAMEDRYSDENQETGDLISGLFTPPDIKLTLTTKQFDVGLSHRFKRLMHWGINCYTGRDATGTLYPYSVAYKVSWSQLASYQWHTLNTWFYPLSGVPSVTQIIPSGTGKQIKFIRFPKSLRFRLLQFKVDMATVGNTSDGPCYLYNISAFIASKQIVPKAVN